MDQGMTVHELKTWPEYYWAVSNGEKTFEIRKNDRNFEVGDYLKLQEYDFCKQEYTGEYMFVRVTYLLGVQPFVADGYVCMAIKKL